ncbi:MAG: hypothetical protein ACI361_03655 [Atopobiaceae bacterium]
MNRHADPGMKPPCGRWGKGVCATLLALALVAPIGAATFASAQEMSTAAADAGLAPLMVSSSSTNTQDLAPGGTYDLSAYNTGEKTQVLRIKQGGTYYISQSTPGSTRNVQIKIDADADETVNLWLGTVTISNATHDLSAISIEDDSMVVIHSMGGSTATLIGGAKEAGSDDAGAGIYVNDDAQVRFASDARIVAMGGSSDGVHAGYKAAGIGGAGSGHSNSGRIIFDEGCVVEAHGGAGAAGIGSGDNGTNDYINVYGGMVSAYGGERGAGIGSGSVEGAGDGGDLKGDITIFAGAVTAQGGTSAAGIGTGKDGDLDAGIWIKGGTVTAAAGDNAAGIGTGEGRDLEDCIYFQGGLTTVSGGNGAVGLGNGGNFDSGNYISIENGTIWASSLSGTKDKSQIKICGGSVKALTTEALSGIDAKTPVYRAKLAVPDPTTPVTSIRSNTSYSATADIYPDEEGYVYLYLPVQGGSTDNQVTLVQNGKTYAYHDNHTVQSNSQGMLRMDAGTISMSADTLLAGGTATVTLADEDPLWEGGTWTFTATGAAIGEGQPSSPGASVTVSAAQDALGSYTVAATLATPSKGYWTASGTAQAKIKAMPSLSIPNLTKNYDGASVTAESIRSQVTTNSDGALTVSLEQQSGSDWLAVGAATDAGHYRVVATTDETESFDARTAYQEFDILQAQTTTAISAQRMTEGDTVTGWTFTAQVAGMISGQGTVTFMDTTNGAQNVLGTVDVDASCKAVYVLSSEGVMPGTYEVSARFDGTQNYASSKASLAAFSDLRTRSIMGTTTYTATYGSTEPFALALTTDASLGATDRWSYEVVADSYESYEKSDGTKAEKSVSVSPDGMVSVQHAGTSTIKVTLSDGSQNKTYQDASILVSITVGKAPLSVSSYAYASDANVPVTSAVYGSLDSLAGMLRYSYDGGATWTTGAPDWNAGFAGSLSAGRIDETAAAGTSVTVPIVQNAGTFTVGGTPQSGFFSRDYEISFVEGESVSVTKRPLTVNLDDIWGTYGGEAPAITWSYDKEAQAEDGGLAAIDTKDTVFQELPVLRLDEAVTGSADFAALPVRYENGEVAAYQDAVEAVGGSSANYDVTFQKGSLAVMPEQLSDAIRISIAGGTDYTYDGTAHMPEGFVVQDRDVTLAEGTDYTIALSGNMVDAGLAAVTFTGSGNYTGTATATYTIDPADLKVTTPSAEKTYDGTPLTASAGASLEGLVGDDGAKISAIGTITDAGTTENSYEIAWAEGTKAENYRVRAELGTLTVDQKVLTVATYSARKAYDGKPLTAGGALQGLVSGESATLQTTGSQTEVGRSANTYELGWGTAKEANYRLDEHIGTLIVGPSTLAITIQAPSGAKRYDGTPLVAGDAIKVMGLPEGFRVKAAASGARSEIGHADTAISWYAIYDRDGKDVTANFPNVKLLKGRLTVTSENPIVVTATGGSFVYDGQAHGATVAVEGLPEGYTYEASSSASATHVADGTIVAKADHLVIRNAEGRDVTSELDLAFVDGEISITPARLSVKTEGASKAYDGEALTAPGTLSGLVNNETASFRATGSQTLPGQSENSYELLWDGTAQESDYTVAEELGTLTVTRQDAAPAQTSGSTNGTPNTAVSAKASSVPNTGDATSYQTVALLLLGGSAIICAALMLKCRHE